MSSTHRRLNWQRVGMIFLTGILGCTTVKLEEETTPPGRAQPEAMTLEEQPFRIQDLTINEERGQTTFHIKLSGPVTQYRHFSLSQPSRVVLDVFGEAKTLPRVDNFRAETHWVSTVRLSSSEGYLRIVIEIAAATVPAYVVELAEGGLRVVIGPLNPALTAKKEIQLIQGGKRADVKAVETKPVKPPEAAPAHPEAAPAPPPVPGAQPALLGEKKYLGQRISLDFKDADIKNVFRLMAEVSGKNIIVTSDVTRKLTVRLVDVPWDQALDLIIDTNGLGKDEIGNVIRISTTEQLRRESDARAAAIKAKETEEPLQTAYLSVNYAKVKDLESRVKEVLTSRGKVVADDRSNTLIVRDIKQGINEANTVVSRLDTRTPQVLIESNLIETSPTFARALGFQFNFDAPFRGDGNTVRFRSSFSAGAPAVGGTPFFSVFRERLGSFENIEAVLTAAESEGNVRIISRPSVVTLNNVASTIQSLRILRIALPTGTSSTAVGAGAAAGATVATEKVNTGIILTVTPQVSSDGFVLMNISVKSSSIASSASAGASELVIPFDELSREALANVLVRDGETIVIGGILKDTSASSEAGIPYLKDIPVLGWFLKNIRWQKDFEELMVFITPRIVGGGSENLPNAEQLWREQLRRTEGKSS